MQTISEYQYPFNSYRNKVLDKNGAILCTCQNYELANNLATILNNYNNLTSKYVQLVIDSLCEEFDTEVTYLDIIKQQHPQIIQKLKYVLSIS